MKRRSFLAGLAAALGLSQFLTPEPPPHEVTIDFTGFAWTDLDTIAREHYGAALVSEIEAEQRWLNTMYNLYLNRPNTAGVIVGLTDPPV